ncbi:MAG: 16S rRNA (cytosine(967)-C(5))-methyltransferase RsmB [Ndongobacter sp.]|nr:16S rRNA (cytosine(967)-C(5))-methyltransferase RsmB [Ndongobacter sp.]
MKAQLRKTPSARQLAVDALIDVERGGDFSQKAVQRQARALDERDRRFLRELVYGVLENRMYLDYLIDRVSSRPVSSMQPLLRSALRTGAFELFFLHTPTHAAVNEAVSVVRRRLPQAGGFANAILRALDRKRDQLALPAELDAMDRISLRYSHPRWILETLRSRYPEEQLEELAKQNNTPAPLCLFALPQKGSREEVCSELREEGIETKESEMSRYALVVQGGTVTESRAFREGRVTVQSPPSICAAEAAVSADAGHVLDLCAAPGSKSCVMASLMPQARIVANDLQEKKRQSIEENLRRMRLTNVVTTVRDATVFHEDWERAFDVVLVDAPCSGLGLLRRKPDIRWNRRAEDIAALAELQRSILTNAIRYVRPGGRLVYSTCTLTKEENEDQALWLEEHTGWSKEPFRGRMERCFSPLEDNCDGFYVVRFRAGEEAQCSEH